MRIISVAIQKGNYVVVFDDKKQFVAQVYGELYGYTETTYSVKKGKYVVTYDSANHFVSQNYVG